MLWNHAVAAIQIAMRTRPNEPSTPGLERYKEMDSLVLLRAGKTLKQGKTPSSVAMLNDIFVLSPLVKENRYKRRVEIRTVRGLGHDGGKKRHIMNRRH